MNRLRLTFRFALADLRRDRAVTAITVGALALVVLTAMAVAGWYFFFVMWTSTAVATSAALVFVITRLLLGVQDRRRTRAGALLTLSGARPADVRRQRVASAGMVALAADAAAMTAYVSLLVLPPMPFIGRLQWGFTPVPYGPTGPLEEPAVHLTTILLAALLAAVLAAVLTPVPRTDELAPNLAGRRPAGSITLLHPLGAVVLAAAGIALLRSNGYGWRFVSVALLAGSMFLAGSCLLRVCEPLGRRFGVPGTLAGRALNRQRYRTAPLVGLTAVALAVAVVMIIATTTTQDDAPLSILARYRQVTAPADAVVVNVYSSGGVANTTVPQPIVDRVVAVVPGSHATRIPLVGRPYYGDTIRSWNPVTGAVGSGWLPGVATREALDGLGLTDHLVDVAAGRALVLNPLALDGEHVAVDLDGDTVSVPAVDVSRGEIVRDLPPLLLPPAFVEQHHAAVTGEATLVRSPGALTAENRAAIEQATVDRFGGPVANGGSWSIGPIPGQRLLPDGSGLGVLTLPGPVEPVSSASAMAPHELAVQPTTTNALVVLALLLATALSLAALALGIIQRRPDDVLLALQGARPGLRRLSGAIESGVIAGLGALLATALGPAIVWSFAEGIHRYRPNSRSVITVPWPTLALLLVVVPVVLGVLAYVVTPPLRRLDVSRLSDDG